MPMEPSDVCYELIEHYEELVLEAYPDPGSRLGQALATRSMTMPMYRQLMGWENLDGSPWTIGYGHTLDVAEGDVCTKPQAEAWMTEDIDEAVRCVTDYVHTVLKQCQFDALVSLAFSIGTPEFARSTLLGMLNHGLWDGAAHQFGRWNHSKGRVLRGLTFRREAERRLFTGSLDPTSPGFAWPGS